jgi:hypothetical protein
MFNALNRFISRLDGDVQQQRQQERGSFGFQVLRNTNLDLAIEPWFDFIVGINGRPIVRTHTLTKSPPNSFITNNCHRRTLNLLFSARK